MKAFDVDKGRLFKLRYGEKNRLIISNLESSKNKEEAKLE